MASDTAHAAQMAAKNREAWFAAKKKQYHEEIVALSVLGHFDERQNIIQLDANGGDADAAHNALAMRMQYAMKPLGGFAANASPPGRKDPFKHFQAPQEDGYSGEIPSWAFDGLGAVRAIRGMGNLNMKSNPMQMAVPDLPSDTLSPRRTQSYDPNTIVMKNQQMDSFMQKEVATNPQGIHSFPPDAPHAPHGKYKPGTGGLMESNIGPIPGPDPERLLQMALRKDAQSRVGEMIYHSDISPPPIKKQKIRQLAGRPGGSGNSNAHLLMTNIGGVPLDLDELDCGQCHNGEDFSTSYVDGVGQASFGGQANHYSPAGTPGVDQQMRDMAGSPEDGNDKLQGSNNAAPHVNARDRKIAAQRRYRTKKKNELQRLKHIEREHMLLKQRMELLKPFEIIAKVEQARMDTGKRPRQWCYVETWPECKIISEMLCSEALGYSLLGRHCWDYKRFPGLNNAQGTLRDVDAQALKQHWNATVAKGGYSLYDFLDNQFFERLSYRDGKPVWRWSQVVAYRINDPFQKPALLQCLENDCHEAVMFGRRHGVTEYLKSVGEKHAFHYILDASKSISYSCYVSRDVVREHTTKKSTKDRAIVVQRADASVQEILGWDINGMPADEDSPGRGVPLLCGPNNRMEEIIRTGRTHEPMYYKRLRVIPNKEGGANAASLPDPLAGSPGSPKSRKIDVPTGREDIFIVEAWAHMARPAGDGGVFIEIFERDAVPNALREQLEMG